MAYTCQRYSGLIVAVFGHTLMREPHAVGCATLGCLCSSGTRRIDGVMCSVLSQASLTGCAGPSMARRKLALLPSFYPSLAR